MTRAVIYLRTSTEERAEGRLSIDAQEKSCRSFCERSGFEVVAVVIDEGVCGTLAPTGRIGFTRAIGFMKRRDVLVVARRDRLACNREVIVAIESEVRRAKGIILSAEGEGTSLDVNEPYGKFLSHMIDALNEFKHSCK